MDHGKVQQVDTPTGAYRRPLNRFVAGFIGSANLFDGRLEQGATEVLLAGGERVPCTPDHGLRGAVCVVVRPEHLEVLESGAATGLPATVVEVVYFGQAARIHLKLASGATVIAIADAARPLPVPGQQARLAWQPEHTWVMAA
jgi:ABC-type Fe3+/spermidine/putrescine transport system ATPase subunit